MHCTVYVIVYASILTVYLLSPYSIYSYSYLTLLWSFFLFHISSSIFLHSSSIQSFFLSISLHISFSIPSFSTFHHQSFFIPPPFNHSSWVDILLSSFLFVISLSILPYPLYPLSLFSDISSFSISHNPPFPIPSIPTCALFSPFSDPSSLSASHHPFFLYPSLFQAVSHIVILLPNFSFTQSFLLIFLLTFYIESYICTVQK